MKSTYFQTVSRNNTKILRRSWLFRVFMFLTFILILSYQLSTQSHLFMRFSGLGVLSLPSFVPYLNAYLFNIFQVFPLIFLAGSFFNKDQKLDTLDIIYTRPESNAGYVGGICWAIVRTFMIVAAISLLCAALIHLTATQSPFSLWPYLFYWLTLLLPTMVYITGFSFLLLSFIPNRALNIIFMVGYAAISLFYLDDTAHSLFDFSANALPSVFSLVTGHADVGLYLLQRLTFLFLGIGLMGCAILRFKRLPNSPSKRLRYLAFSTLFLILGLLSGVTYYSHFCRQDATRKSYVETYARYEKMPKLSLLQENISYEGKGRQMTVNCELTVKNNHTASLAEGIIYLNPGLDVKSIREEGREIPFERENQVVILKRNFAAGEEVGLQLEYQGRPDEAICYVDIRDADYYDEGAAAHGVSRYGKKYLYLEKNYTLLTPECIWYPVTTPPVNPQAVYEIQRSFTRYRLEVKQEDGKTVISQGDKSIAGDRIVFEEKHPLTGISLCIGDYQRYAVEDEDGVVYETYLLPGSEVVLEPLAYLKDSLPQLIQKQKNETETQFGRTYPFASLRLVESPIAFNSYFRNEQGGNGLLQPAMIFMPERGVGIYTLDFDKQKKMHEHFKKQGAGFQDDRTDEEIDAGYISSFLQGTFMAEQKGIRGGGFNVMMRLLGRRPGGFFHNNNPLYISPMFFNFVNIINASDYKVMDPVLNLLLRLSQEENGSTLFRGADQAHTDALKYLTHKSFRDAVYDPDLDQVVLYEIFKQKAEDFCNRLIIAGVSQKEFNRVFHQFMDENKFADIDFARFNERLIEEFGVDYFRDILPDWYTVDRAPAFIIKDVTVTELDEEVGEEESANISRRGRVEFKVWNPTDVDGVITLSSDGFGGSGLMGGMVSFSIVSSTSSSSTGEAEADRDFAIKAGEAKQIAFVLENVPQMLSINTHISQNLPSSLEYRSFGREKTTDTTQYIREIDKSCFQPAPGEIIVDNMDPGFHIGQAVSGSKLRQWLRGNKQQKEEFYNPFMMLQNASQWSPLTDASFYGDIIKSAYAIPAGKGDMSVSWTAELAQPGSYDIYVYQGRMFGGFAMVSFSISLNRQSMRGGRMSQEPDKQCYTIAYGDVKEDVVLEMNREPGWNLLGTFELPAGSTTITLTNQGEKGQTINADAVKWSYVE